jgi:hypothetical protein
MRVIVIGTSSEAQQSTRKLLRADIACRTIPSADEAVELALLYYHDAVVAHALSFLHGLQLLGWLAPLKPPVILLLM